MGKQKDPGWQYDTDANTRIKGDWQMFPVKKVCAGCMAPVHWAPNCVVGVVLSDYCNFVYDYDNDYDYDDCGDHDPSELNWAPHFVVRVVLIIAS